MFTPVVSSALGYLRIGVTGASGGASPALFLAAVDARMVASAPVVMVDATIGSENGDICENGMPIRELTSTNNAEIAAVFAPKPQLIVSDGHDWTSHPPKESEP